MPDFQQLAVVALALVPGFIASEVQSFVALRRRPPALETTLTAIAYSALLYYATTLGRWGPQFDPEFSALIAGDEGGVLSALSAQGLLARYLALIGASIVLGWVTGRSLARGWARSVVAFLTGRNVISSTWQGFFRDSPTRAVWVELADKRRIVGQVTAASDALDERVVVLAWPHILNTSGAPVAMNLDRLMIDGDRCNLIGVLPESAVDNGNGTIRQRVTGWIRDKL